MTFPTERLRRAGASDSELAQLQGEYDESSPAAKQSLVTHLEEIVDQDIREWVDDLRRIGHFGASPTPVGATNDAPEGGAGTHEPDGQEAGEKPKPKGSRKASEPVAS